MNPKKTDAAAELISLTARIVGELAGAYTPDRSQSGRVAEMVLRAVAAGDYAAAASHADAIRDHGYAELAGLTDRLHVLAASVNAACEDGAE